ncbi:hypothetical protein ACWDR0_03870 [Streptomyces sp. NPDC003691]
MEELGGALVRTAGWLGRNALTVLEAVLTVFDAKQSNDERKDRRRRRRGTR